jgi:hypothetical protein
MNTLSTIAHRQRRDANTRSTFVARSRWLLAAALAAASLGAVAQTVAPLSRADVNAELQRARASGEMERSMSESFGLVWLQDRHRPGTNEQPATAAKPKQPTKTGAQKHSELTREQVRAELIRARQAGELDHASIEVNVPQLAGPARPALLAGN